MLGLLPIGADALGGEGSPPPANTITGLQATAAVGISAANVTLSLAGISTSGSVGDIIVGDHLSGISLTASCGALESLAVSVILSGVSATGQVGAVGIVAALTGVSAAGSVGTMGLGAALTGLSATISAGNLGADKSVRLYGVSAKGSVSPLLVPISPPVVIGGGLGIGGPARVRWVGRRVSVDGTDLGFGLSGPMTVDSSVDFGQRGTLGFHLTDRAWPAADNLWGNKPVEAYISLGDSPRKMTESKVFTGYTFQKKDAAGTSTESDITCADAALAYTGIPVCYSLGAYSGKTRGEILIEVAATVGVTLTDVPAGGIVNKPVQLNNADLLQFITEFGLVENWYPHIDANGNLSVRVLGEPVKAWELDAARGDYDLDSLTETYPTQAPCRWYITGTEAVLATIDGNPNTVTTIQVDEEEALYNPKCRLSYNSTGFSLPSAQLMVVLRTTTETTTVAGDEIKKVTTIESFYNPAAYDPNYNTTPAGTDYSDAYNDKSFHVNAVETLMETSKVTVDTFRDALGTVTGQKTTTLGWFSRQSSILPNADNRRPIYQQGGIPIDYSNWQGPENGSGHWIYGDGKAHVEQGEHYGIVSEIETDYTYGADGVMTKQVSNYKAWFSPRSQADIAIDWMGPEEDHDNANFWMYDLDSPQHQYYFRVMLQSVSVSNQVVQPEILWGSQGFYYFARRNDYKYGEQDWRLDDAETYQLVRTVTTNYYSVDGQLARTTEKTQEYANYEAAQSQKPDSGWPPYLFGDGKWYEASADFFTTTSVKMTRYEKFGSNGTAKTTDSINLTTGEVTLGTPDYADGAAPLTPTIGSEFRWARVPITLELTISACDFVDNKASLDLPWAENATDLNRAGVRAAQRAMAVIRELDCPWNPKVDIGDALVLTDSAHGIAAEWHIITDIKRTVEVGADMHLTFESWPTGIG